LGDKKIEHAINKICFNAHQIDNIISNLAKKIDEYYQDYTEIICIIVLKGAKKFSEDLLEKLPDKFKPVFIEAKSYIGKKTQKNVQIDLLNIKSLLDKNVLLIDDIYDTGKTLSLILRVLQTLRSKSLKTCVLLNRINSHEKNIKIDFVGENIFHKDFFVGYGLDYNGKGREWPYIVRVHEDKHAKKIKKIIKGKKV